MWHNVMYGVESWSGVLEWSLGVSFVELLLLSEFLQFSFFNVFEVNK